MRRTYGKNDSHDGDGRLPSAAQVFEQVFSSVSKKGGKISSLSCALGRPEFVFPRKGAGKCSFSIHGCGCEDVVGERFCAASFKSGAPFFELEIPFGKSVLASEGSHGRKMRSSVGRHERHLPLYKDELVLAASFRKKLQELGAVFEIELNGERRAEFVFSAAAAVLYSCLKTAAELAETAEWSEESVSVTENAGKCLVSLSFSKYDDGLGSFCAEILYLCAKYAYLFDPKLRIRRKPRKIFPALPSYLRALVAGSEEKREPGEFF